MHPSRHAEAVESYLEREGPLTFSELKRKTKLDSKQVARGIKTLERRASLLKDEAGRYRLANDAPSRLLSRLLHDTGRLELESALLVYPNSMGEAFSRVPTKNLTPPRYLSTYLRIPERIRWLIDELENALLPYENAEGSLIILEKLASLALSTVYYSSTEILWRIELERLPPAKRAAVEEYLTKHTWFEMLDRRNYLTSDKNPDRDGDRIIVDAQRIEHEIAVRLARFLGTRGDHKMKAWENLRDAMMKPEGMRALKRFDDLSLFPEESHEYHRLKRCERLYRQVQKSFEGRTDTSGFAVIAVPSWESVGSMLVREHVPEKIRSLPRNMLSQLVDDLLADAFPTPRQLRSRQIVIDASAELGFGSSSRSEKMARRLEESFRRTAMRESGIKHLAKKLGVDRWMELWPSDWMEFRRLVAQGLWQRRNEIPEPSRLRELVRFRHTDPVYRRLMSDVPTHD